MQYDLRQETNEKFFTDDPANNCVNILKNRSRYLVLYGGAGSGKSHAIAQKLLIRIAKAEILGYREKFIALRKTQPAVRRSVFALLQHYISKWGMSDICKINKTDMSMTFVGGSQILCMGLDDPEKLKSIEGVTGVWMEETTEFTEGDFIQVDLRLRGDTPSYKQIILSFNPVDLYSFLNERFCENTDPDATVIHSTYRDNKFIDAEYGEVLEGLKDKDETLWKIYNQGIWAALLNIIYSNYKIVAAADWPDHFDEKIYGLDYGYNSPSAVVEIGFLDEQVYERELIYEPKLHPEDIVARMQALGISGSDPVYYDPSRPDIGDKLEAGGFYAQKGDNDVKGGITHVKMICTHIHEGSENLKKEKKTYKYKEDRNGNVFDEPVKAWDHAMDAERYGLYTHSGAMPFRILVL